MDITETFILNNRVKKISSEQNAVIKRATSGQWRSQSKFGGGKFGGAKYLIVGE